MVSFHHGHVGDSELSHPSQGEPPLPQGLTKKFSQSVPPNIGIDDLRAGLIILTCKLCACIDIVTGRIKLARLTVRIEYIIQTVLHCVDPKVMSGRLRSRNRDNRVAACCKEGRV